MVFILSIIPSALFNAGYAYLVLYREATLRTRVVQTVLRFAVCAICYVAVNIASILALGAIFLAFGWNTGGETTFRMQAVALTVFASLSGALIADPSLLRRRRSDGSSPPQPASILDSCVLNKYK